MPVFMGQMFSAGLWGSGADRIERVSGFVNVALLNPLYDFDKALFGGLEQAFALFWGGTPRVTNASVGGAAVEFHGNSL